MRAILVCALALVVLTVFVRGEGVQQYDQEIDPAAARGSPAKVEEGAPAKPLSKSGLPAHLHRFVEKDGQKIWFPEMFEGGANEKEQHVMDWALNHSFVDGGISFQKSFGASGRGMVYTRDVKAGEEVLGVPVDLMVYTSSAHLGETTHKVLRIFRERARTPGMVAEDFELTEMGLIVMFEKRNSSSFFKYYLEQIQDPLCPAFYTDAELAKFEYSWIKTWRLYFMADALRNFQKLITEPDMEFAKSPTAEFEFLWAVSTVLQRSFDWGPDTRREYVMVPILDMVNHRKNVNNNYYYSSGPFTRQTEAGASETVELKRGMVLGTDTEHKKGEEIYISYSMSSNSIQLLLQYGFVEADNEHDYVILSVPEPKDAEKAAKLEELGPVVSVGKDGVVSTSFYRALNFALTGVAELTQTAAELVLSYIQKDLGKFSTTLEQDQASLKAGNLDRAEYSAVAYRVEAKKNLHAIVNHVTGIINKLKKKEALVDVQSSSTKLDWPIRFIRVATQELGEPDEEPIPAS